MVQQGVQGVFNPHRHSLPSRNHTNALTKDMETNKLSLKNASTSKEYQFILIYILCLGR